MNFDFANIDVNEGDYYYFGAQIISSKQLKGCRIGNFDMTNQIEINVLREQRPG